MAVLLREAIGDRLRHARTTQHRTLRDISGAARVSLGYLSEVERGQKEASSELLASICDALDLPVAQLLHNVAADMSAVNTAVNTVQLPGTRTPEARVSVPQRPSATAADLGLDLVLQETLDDADLAAAVG